MTLSGIDISHWQPNTPSLSGLSFVFARATYQTFPDDRYAQHKAAAQQAGLIFGAYHFGVAAQFASIQAQVDAFLNAAGDAHLLILDLERDGTRTSMTPAEGSAFIATLRAKDPRRRRIGLYHSDSGFPSLGQDFDHVAKWSSTPPTRDWTFWQYSATPIDRNYYNGTAAELRTLAGLLGGMREVQFVNAFDSDVKTDKKIHAPKGTQVYRLDGKPLYVLPATLDLPVLGHADSTSSDYVVLIETQTVYEDHRVRPTLLLVRLPGVTPA